VGAAMIGRACRPRGGERSQAAGVVNGGVYFLEFIKDGEQPLREAGGLGCGEHDAHPPFAPDIRRRRGHR
jgi:hypothetical protein